MDQILPVILCGGSGTRLWPLSRSGFPKQFLVIPGGDEKTSLFQQAVLRVRSISNVCFRVEPPLVVTNEEHRFLALDQLRDLKNNQSTLFLEPSGRNTAPALTMAALFAIGREVNSKSDPILIVLPADQVVSDDDAFIRALQKCICIAQEDSIAILGIPPASPETGYGYIKAMAPHDSKFGLRVDHFVEKPDKFTAQKFIDEGNYFWNSGIFVLRASVWLAALKEFRPDILSSVKKAWEGKAEDNVGDAKFMRPDREAFNLIPCESIDCAVIEKCPGSNFVIQMVELDAGWNDLGSWDAVWQTGQKDELGNVTSGDTLLLNSKNNLVYADHRLVGTVGVENLIIIETADAILVVDRLKSQNVKHIVNELANQKRDEKNLHRKVVRPWGWYDSIDEDGCFKVKRIQVKPAASLSLQMHHYRAEHWIVVRGSAEVTNGEEVIFLKENQSIYIPRGQKHRLANPGDTLLEIIEVQSGEYLGEDDIVRFKDTYGRS
ncbi:mannose-1-phosphate guanylyltransferase/mannose-6-phosphate isomerase [Polynucleobacter duraquae]|uniref:mannose-1-phosphate guanylyltransferase n=1 Tax=Polynucleobacter duraquae TaxID=1835254 RepID=A0A0E3ZIT5_9BURK|nr:mannose-1-phosphate guanylyltransferase/mannose-6-phosphate isomerase [Polynucleobacter duraquae]AKD24642.1 mannose-1-phosphate guanylyltransferase/mannose-6-phosphate isomerase [Polynucleobacter duraquae]